MPISRLHDMVEEILFDILLYLPVMSLLRFKVVCKYWFCLIESSVFISQHLKHNRDNKEDDFIIMGVVRGSRFCKPEIGLLSGSQYEKCVYDIDIGEFWHSSHLACETGYCDGIVCLVWGVEVALWNPALKQLRPIPPTLSVTQREGIFQCFDAFGIDVKSNVYKLVRIWLEYGINFDDMIANQVEVYNLGGDSSWRTTHKDDILPFLDIPNLHGAVSSSKSGKCFWVARSYEYTAILLSFDFSDDVFGTMPLPDGNLEPEHFDLDLLDDKVVYFVDKSGDNVKAFDIWMLHEFGVEESWNIIYKVAFPGRDDFHSRRISKNGEFLICSKSEELYLYNLHTQRGKFIQNCNLELGTDEDMKCKIFMPIISLCRKVWAKIIEEE